MDTRPLSPTGNHLTHTIRLSKRSQSVAEAFRSKLWSSRLSYEIAIRLL